MFSRWKTLITFLVRQTFRLNPPILKKIIKLATLPQSVWVSSPGNGLLLPLPLCQACSWRHKLGWECLATTCQWLNEDRVMRSCGGDFGPVPPVEWINVSFIPHLADPSSPVQNKGRGDLQFPSTWVGTSQNSGSPGDASAYPETET